MKQLAAILLFPLMILSSHTAAGQQADSGNTPFILGTVEEIRSVELSETRTVNIYLPDGYSPDSAAVYPVIYLLDGSANEDFIHIVGVVQFLTMIEAMPRSIVVGIANIDRKRDFTFPTTNAKDKKDYPTTGSSAKFIAFIEKELQPFISSKYKTSASSTVIGQSLGGLLATEILLKKPEMFTAYIIVSPSLWWDDESLLNKAPELLKSGNRNQQVYISVGTEGKQMENDAAALAKALKTLEGQKTWFYPMPEENHLTILHHSVYKALEILNKKK